MRAAEDPEFAKFLEETGLGLYKGDRKNYIRIDKPGVMCSSAGEVVRTMYEGHLDDFTYLRETCVLAVRNVEFEAINNYVLRHVGGVERVYMSIDTPAPGVGMQIPPEYLETLMESGMPPHELKLKVSSIVILLRNLDPDEGLCNGTRMKIVKMYNRFVEAEILDGRFAGSVHAIGKIRMSNEEIETKKTKFSRLQLPLRLAYCLTINKSQGQTFRRIGLILENNPFAHGHLYVALSRVHSFSELKVFSKARVKSEDGVVLVNIVDDSIVEGMREAQLAAEKEASVADAPSQISATGSQGLARLITREYLGSVVTGFLRKPLDVLRSSVRKPFKAPLVSANQHPADANLQSSAPSSQIAPRLGRPLPLPPPTTRPRRDDPNLDASFPSSLESSQMAAIVKMYNRFVEAEILDGRFAGSVHAIGKIRMSNEEIETKKTKFSRLQLPLRLAYCLTINKSQGQTFRRIGLILENNPFAHGHLYVALSRVHSFSELKVFSKARVKSEDGVVLVNIVDDSIVEGMREAQLAAEKEASVADAPSQISATGSQGLARLITREYLGSVVTGFLRKPLDVLRSSVRKPFKAPLVSANQHPADANLQSSAPSSQIAPRLGRPLPLPPPTTRPRRDDPNLDASFPSSLESSQMAAVPPQRPWTPSPPHSPHRRKHSPSSPPLPPRRSRQSPPPPPPPLPPRRRNVPPNVVLGQTALMRGLSTPGLIILGSDCFLNAAIQVLRRLPILVDRLRAKRAEYAAAAGTNAARAAFLLMPAREGAMVVGRAVEAVQDETLESEIINELCRLVESDRVDTTRYLRQLLDRAYDEVLGPNFKYGQHDSAQLLQALIGRVLFEFDGLFMHSWYTKRTCRGVSDCNGTERGEAQCISVFQIGRDGQVLDLETIFNGEFHEETMWTSEKRHCMDCCTRRFTHNIAECPFERLFVESTKYGLLGAEYLNRTTE